MDQLENQVSDLRSFLRHPPEEAFSTGIVATTTSRRTSDGPATASDTASPSGPRPPQPAAANSKRRAEDEEDGQKQQRSKRNRYISLACTECKRRKIRCNGQQPCGRCGHLNLACLYSANCCSGSFKESDDYRRMTDQIAALQDQVNALFENMDALRQETLRLTPGQDQVLGHAHLRGVEGGGAAPPMVMGNSFAHSPASSTNHSLSRRHRAPSIGQHSRFCGPTSIDYTVDVAKDSMRRMGYSGERAEAVEDAGPAVADPLAMAVPASLPSSALYLPEPSAAAPDPLWSYDRDEMIRLCRIHEDEVGLMYPVFDADSVVAHVETITEWMESVRRHRLPPSFVEGGLLSSIKTMHVKILMCSALAIEAHGHSPKAAELFETMRPFINRKLLSDPADLGSLQILNGAAAYHFLCNEDLLAWRTMGQVGRLCLELGLHRRQGLYRIPEGEERQNALKAFWMTYTLDRRWAFATGLPYAIQDDNIDPKLPYPDWHPYMVAMITYSKLAAKVWKLVDYFDAAVVHDIKREELEALDKEIIEWSESVPEEIRISNLRELPSSRPSYNVERRQIWMRLRLNQIRIWLYMPVLHCASSIQQNKEMAFTVVGLAQDTIQYLKKMHDKTDLYRRLQVFYHQFLLPAIAALFLASVHAPVEFSSLARPEFYMALELIKDLSAKSWVSQRLWRTVHSLKHYATRIGLQEDDGGVQQEDRPPSGHGQAPISLAGLGVAGIARSVASSAQTPTNVQGSGSPDGGAQGIYPPPPSRDEARSAPSQHQPLPTSAPHTRGPLDGGGGGGGGVVVLPELTQNLTEGRGQGLGLDDEQNGSALQSEMSRIFEDYLGLGGVTLPPAGPGNQGVGGGGGSCSFSSDCAAPSFGIVEDVPLGLDQDIGVFQQFREIF